jgi:hypothetical protein
VVQAASCKEVKRWYMVVDANAVPFEGTMPEWYYLSDVISDKDSNVYFASAVDSDNDLLYGQLIRI